MNLYKCPGAKTPLARVTIQLGIASHYDTLFLYTGPRRVKKVPLWLPDKDAAAEFGCSQRTYARWRWARKIIKYGTDYSRPGYPRKMRIAA